MRPFTKNLEKDKRYTTRVIGGGSSAKANLILFGIDAITWGLEKYTNSLIKEDVKLAEEHEKILHKICYSSNYWCFKFQRLYPRKYRNDFDLSLIANSILYGEKVDGYEEQYNIVNSSGSFTISNMRVGGPYKIEISKSGEAPMIYDDVYLELDSLLF